MGIIPLGYLGIFCVIDGDSPHAGRGYSRSIEIYIRFLSLSGETLNPHLPYPFFTVPFRYDLRALKGILKKGEED